MVVRIKSEVPKKKSCLERLFFIIPNFSASVNRILTGPTVYISLPL